MCIQL